MNDDGQRTTDESRGEERAPVLRLEPRRLERRIPGVGLVRFRAPAAAAEAALEPLYGDDVDARTFANELIAACVESPAVAAADVDGWGERARAIARVAATQTVDCFAAYRRLAGSGRDGDERLREAMRSRNEELAKRLRMTMAALGASTNVARLFEPSRLAATSAVERMMRQQREIERLLKPDYLTDWSRLSQQFVLARPTQFEQLTNLASSPALDAVRRLSRSPLLMPQHNRLFGIGSLPGFDFRRSPLYGQLEQLKKLSSLASRATLGIDTVRAFDLSRSPLFAQMEQLKKLTTSFAIPRGLFGVSGDVAGIGRLAGSGSPSYFGALHGVGRMPEYSKLFGAIGEQLYPRAFASHYDTISRLLERMREQVTGPLRAYVGWVEREWAQAKAEHRPPPVLFVLASLPALVGLQLLEELRADDEPLLSSLEQELENGALAAELQTTVQRNGLLDPVAKRHLAQAVDWVAVGRYVDAAPPLYQGLERAFRLTARARGVVDVHGHFVVPGVRRVRMRKIEDTFRHLGLDHLYLRFLHAWVFGEVGNLARHGDLPEVEHRQWVLRAVVALVGWLEYVGGEADAVAALVERLELESASSAEVVA